MSSFEWIEFEGFQVTSAANRHGRSRGDATGWRGEIWIPIGGSDDATLLVDLRGKKTHFFAVHLEAPQEKRQKSGTKGPNGQVELHCHGQGELDLIKTSFY